ncbi:p21-activated protein kinase-interacting protein 1-like [Onthophagus taurus]|uniref:p21-activated protein kinase-interacting protein 1-like n=1 Tax=Onthophagus taurus TaxID=166361 RepID=UPI0039BE2A4A
MVKTALFEVILGTYEEFLIGYKFNPKSQELVQSFASHTHSSSLRCVSFSNPYLASGGADDRIVIYDLKTRKEHCMLTHHNATVNCLKFTPQHTHLMSGSADGMLSITRVGNWQVEKVWEKAHKGAAIIDIAIHSTGKLALTLGADGSIRTWNLIKGRQAYAINLNSKYKQAKLMQSINWSPNGVDFILCGGNTSDIWSIKSGGIKHSIEHKNKVTHALFFDENTLLVGFENGELAKFSAEGDEIKVIQAHNSRVKSLDTQNGYIVTCSSNGEIKVFDVDLDEIVKCSTGCRHTCLVIIPGEIKDEVETENVEVVKEVKEKNIIKKAKVEVVVEKGVELEDNEPIKKKKKVGFSTDGGKKLKKKKN